jgi:hypothetical protein
MPLGMLAPEGAAKRACVQRLNGDAPVARAETLKEVGVGAFRKILWTGFIRLLMFQTSQGMQA